MGLRGKWLGTVCLPVNLAQRRLAEPGELILCLGCGLDLGILAATIHQGCHLDIQEIQPLKQGLPSAKTAGWREIHTPLVLAHSTSGAAVLEKARMTDRITTLRRMQGF